MRTVRIPKKTYMRAGKRISRKAYTKKITAKAIKAGKKNIKKAQKKWKSMSTVARKRAMPETKTKAWKQLVAGLKRHGDRIKTPEALATYKLGAKGMKNRKRKKGWSKTCKTVKRKGYKRKGYTKKPYSRKSHPRKSFMKDIKPGRGVKLGRIKATHVKSARVGKTNVPATRVKAGSMTICGWTKK